MRFPAVRAEDDLPGGRRPAWRVGPWIAAGGLFAAAVAFGLVVARPLDGASIATDSQASVLYFQRLTAGQRLETFVPTTAKPLLTLVFGVLQGATHDWRTLAWATIAAFGAGVALTAELARRHGGWPAWSFVAAALIGCGPLVFDVGFALATPWAVALVGAAGLALARERPRHLLAGVLLLLAVLARLEVLLVVGVAAVSLAWRRLGPVRWVGRRPAAGEWLVLVGLGSVPVLAVHDWLLTGDPLSWTSVAVRYTVASGYPVLGPASMAGWLVAHLAAEWPLAVLGGAGLLALLVADRGVPAGGIRASRVLAGGVLAFGPGMAALLIVLGAEHVYVPDRYTGPIDLALIVAAGTLVGRVAGLASRRRQGVRPAAAALVAALGAALIGVAAAWPLGAFDPVLGTTIRNSLATAVDTDRVEGTLRRFVTEARAAGTIPGAGPPPAGTVLLRVPGAVRERVALDLSLPLTSVLDLGRNPVRPDDWRGAVGQMVFHDRHVDGRLPALEPATSQPLGGALAVPVVVDPDAGYWVVTIRPR